MIDILFTLGVVALALGPSIRWFMMNKPVDQSALHEKSGTNATGTLIWTTLVLALFMYWSWSRGEKLRDACESFQHQIGGDVVREDQWNQIVDGHWWRICHPDNSDGEES
jgi:hypothetical protein